MEKILRKISCLAPPMDRTKTVLCEHWDGKKELGYFGGEWFNMNGDTIAPECWYEEVDLLEAFKDAYKMEFINNAKERYEKALKFRNKNVATDTPFFYTDYIHIDYVEKALRIAAGLEEV